MFQFTKEQLSPALTIIRDKEFAQFKENWFKNPQVEVSREEFKTAADAWFKSSKLNTLYGWEHFDQIDITTGNTQYIESFFIRYGKDNFQIIENEYAYYGLMGKYGVKVEDLKPNMPLIVTLPHYGYGGMRPEWNQLLQICEDRNIDIHIDFAWLPLASGLVIDLSHPRIQSFAMSLSKFAMTWNKVGLRWSRQRTMDSITIMNHYYGPINSNKFSCGMHMINTFTRDHLWNKYGTYYNDLCTSLGTTPTNLLTIIRFDGDPISYDCGGILTNLNV
jgi:hypothetical protein